MDLGEAQNRSDLTGRSPQETRTAFGSHPYQLSVHLKFADEVSSRTTPHASTFRERSNQPEMGPPSWQSLHPPNFLLSILILWSVTRSIGDSVFFTHK